MLKKILNKLRKKESEETYTSNFGKQRPKPEDKMIREHSDK